MLNKLLINFGANPWNPRGKYRLYRLLSQAGKTIEGTTPAGIRLRFRPDDITCYYFFSGKYETELAGLIGALPRGGVFVDVGANVGNFTVLASRQVGPQGLVAAFEPNGETYARLLHHLVINDAECVVPTNAAVAASAGVLRLVCAENSGLSHLGNNGDFPSSRIQRVAAVSLDTYLPALLENREIDLLKIDVEGAELGVLQGADSLLRTRRIKRLFVEMSIEHLARFGTTPADLWAYLETRGYKPRYRTVGTPIYDEIFDRV